MPLKSLESLILDWVIQQTEQNIEPFSFRHQIIPPIVPGVPRHLTISAFVTVQRLDRLKNASINPPPLCPW
jgi:hypothetical protein